MQKPKLFPLVVLLLAVSVFITACGGPEPTPEPQTVIMATAEPTATPLPEVEGIAELGTKSNPITILFVVEDAGDMEDLAEELTEAFNENNEYFYEIEVTESYREARDAFAKGEAMIATMDAFSYLSLGDNPGGRTVYLLERDGITMTQGQIVGRDRFAPRVYRGRFCRTDPYSLETWIMPRLYLLSVDVDPFLNYTDIIDKDNDAGVIEAVLAGECGMGATSVGAEAELGDLPNIQYLEILHTLPAVPGDFFLVSDRLDGFALGVTEDLMREYFEDMIDILGVDNLVPAEAYDMTDLREFMELSGVDLTALGG